jgi:CDP-paratose 2-epimerase
MSVVVVTGSCGLIGSESVMHFAECGHDVVGIDNDMRSAFFGADASTAWVRTDLELKYPRRYLHHAIDIRDQAGLEQVFGRYGREIALVIHAAAQPSHDWAAHEPFTDFSINATGTLAVLECVRQSCPGAVVIFTSTNKVYGDTPNRLPLVELDRRWELDPAHPAYCGINESMGLDRSTHSLFGVSKLAADVLVQEYGRYFGVQTVCFRAGCVTGPNHSGSMLHGFIAHLLKCTCTGTEYTIFGFKGKQVRDNLHSADLVSAFDAFFSAPRAAEVYNIGGGRACNCSVLEAIALCEEIVRRPLRHSFDERARIGDHIWYISDTEKFRGHYSSWRQTYDLRRLIQEIYDRNVERWTSAVRAR